MERAQLSGLTVDGVELRAAVVDENQARAGAGLEPMRVMMRAAGLLEL